MSHFRQVENAMLKSSAYRETIRLFLYGLKANFAAHQAKTINA